MTKINYLGTEFKEIILSSPNCSSALKTLGLRNVGGNFATIKRWVFKLNINIDHWSSSRGWNKGLQLKSWENYSCVPRLKKHLIKHLGHKCEKCLISMWYDNPICLEVHHVDGDRTNNKLENLQLLCPNCHAGTDNWRGKKNSPGRIRTDNISRLRGTTLPIGLRGQNKLKESKIKIEKVKKIPKEKLSYIPKTKINWPDKDSLEKLIREKSLCQVARELNVSDNAVRKHALKQGIDIKSISKWSHKHGGQHTNDNSPTRN